MRLDFTKDSRTESLAKQEGAPCTGIAKSKEPLGPKTDSSGFRNGGKPAGAFKIRKLPLEHIDPKHCLCPDESVEALHGSPLGEPLCLEDVAAFLGCSPWTVRQKYLPQGLPHLRASLSGKFIFFRHQVVNWILERQARHRKGGSQ